MDEGLITEKNLDRFDTTCLTWRHPHLSSEDLTGLLFECYRKFDSLPRVLRHAKLSSTSTGNMAMSVFNRYCAWRRTHPMSGGIIRVRRDGVNDYISLRRQTYGFDLAPLPESLPLLSAQVPIKPNGQPVHGLKPYLPARHRKSPEKSLSTTSR